MSKCLKCSKTSNFNFKGKKTPIYCNDHKIDGMFNINSKKCLKCDRVPSYNYEGLKPTYCSEHKENGMINTKHKTCFDCKKIPNFNYEGESRAIYCAKHKKDDMIDVIHERCLECEKQAVFNFENETKGKYCTTHKKDKMIDIKNKKCECGKHQPVFSLPGTTAGIWCSKCKPFNAVNVKDKMCKECNITYANKKFDEHCVRCFIHLFPDSKKSTNFKVKENYIFEAVIELLPEDIELVRDKTINNGCSLRRPDLRIDLGSHWICAENDEDCHKDYDNTCENKRTMELYTDMGNRPMILIRFNCDKYNGGESLFKLNKNTGTSVIKSKKEFEKRISAFANIINRYIESEPPEKAVTIEYLYYD